MNHVDTTETINHLSLCSGYEGIGSGLSRVLPNLRNIAYVEREGFPIANLVAKMEAGELAPAPVHTDVKTFPYAEFRGCVDILSGGFPCQPFSAAGKRQATDDPRHLFPAIANGIRECQPRIVFLENVEGILSCQTGDGEPVLQYVLRTLEGMGYRATAGIFSASEVGAPHQRKRVFILGLAYGERSGMRRGWSSEQRRNDINRVQSNTEERDELRSETEGCSRDLRGDNGSSWGAWPARPCEPQHEWEEPRVIEVKSKLDGTTNGSSSRVDATANRVDRLRLLGNGVVPATAAKAFVTLINKLNHE